MVTDSVIDDATRFVIANGRLVERRLLELVRGPAQPAVAHAVLSALDDQVLDLVDDEAVREHARELGRRTLSYLESVAEPSGALPIVLPSVRDHPRAHHWDSHEFPVGLNPTAGIVARLRRQGLTSDWLDRAEAYCRGEVERYLAGAELDGHTALNVVVFAAGLDDRAWSAAQLRALGERLDSLTLFHLYPGEGYGLSPLQFAPLPEAAAGRCFRLTRSRPTCARSRRRSRTTAAGRSPGTRPASSPN